jgi:hypothetical protein
VQHADGRGRLSTTWRPCGDRSPATTSSARRETWDARRKWGVGAVERRKRGHCPLHVRTCRSACFARASYSSASCFRARSVSASVTLSRSRRMRVICALKNLASSAIADRATPPSGEGFERSGVLPTQRDLRSSAISSRSSRVCCRPTWPGQLCLPPQGLPGANWGSPGPYPPRPPERLHRRGVTMADAKAGCLSFLRPRRRQLFGPFLGMAVLPLTTAAAI